MKENIIINYLLLEQILRITGTYKNICNEHEFLPEIFKQAKTGDVNPLFQNNNAKDTALGIIERLTGVSTKYWSGQESIKLGIRIKDIDLSYDGLSIDTANLGQTSEKEFYDEHFKNPLHLDYEAVYEKVTGLKIGQDLVKENEHINDIITSLYSLKSLITILLINMEEASIVELIDKANIYKHSKWEHYIRNSSKTTKDGITYSPKYVEIRKGLVQTIIENLLDLGYVFTFRDLGGDIVIKNDETKENEYKIKEFKI